MMLPLLRYLSLCVILLPLGAHSEISERGLIQQSVNSSVQRMSLSFQQQLAQNPTLIELASYEHDIDIGAATVIFYTQPELAIDALRQQPLAGLDTVQATAFIERRDGQVVTVTNSSDYLIKRYQLSLRSLASWQSINHLAAQGSGRSRVEPGEGLIIRHSPLSVDAALKAIKANITANDQLQLAADIDYSKLAQQYQQVIPQAELLLIAAPSISTLLLKQQPNLAADLFPLKLLVTKDKEQGSQLVFSSLPYGLERHQVTLNKTQLTAVNEHFNQLWQPLLESAQVNDGHLKNNKLKLLYWLLAAVIIIGLIFYKKRQAERTQ